MSALSVAVNTVTGSKDIEIKNTVLKYVTDSYFLNIHF